MQVDGWECGRADCISAGAQWDSPRRFQKITTWPAILTVHLARWGGGLEYLQHAVAADLQHAVACVRACVRAFVRVYVLTCVCVFFCHFARLHFHINNATGNHQTVPYTDIISKMSPSVTYYRAAEPWSPILPYLAFGMTFGKAFG